MTECQKRGCRNCRKVKIEFLEKFKEDEVDPRKIADHLSWAVTVDEVTGGKTIISRGNSPKVLIKEIELNSGAQIAVELRWPQKLPSTLFFPKTGSVEFRKFKLTKAGTTQVVRQAVVSTKKGPDGRIPSFLIFNEDGLVRWGVFAR